MALATLFLFFKYNEASSASVTKHTSINITGRLLLFMKYKSSLYLTCLLLNPIEDIVLQILFASFNVLLLAVGCTRHSTPIVLPSLVLCLKLLKCMLISISLLYLLALLTNFCSTSVCDVPLLTVIFLYFILAFFKSLHIFLTSMRASRLSSIQSEAPHPGLPGLL